MSVGRYRKKPVVIEAARYDGTRASIDTICRWANSGDAEENVVEYEFRGADDVSDVTIATLEGYLTVSPGDYVIKGVQGEFYPCKPDIFAATYEPVTS